ncbi:uncharacterized protein HD556DRAFT_830142 [Suillus plorans]|uniref:Uncharacterized protein n=1 Tax=Suillus plorans TaxID=116603 RepID=A0A9P7AHQ7_9AGAM|nr:uncharacterized protein HD556DRAFT_830142 [Suillus plorans]KAG1789060.1 hypothetical protein HD556DRAFT_830142 [Suillus plorans]
MAVHSLVGWKRYASMVLAPLLFSSTPLPFYVCVLHIAGRLQSGLQKAAYSVGMCSREQTNKMFLAVARLVCTQQSLSCGGIHLFVRDGSVWAGQGTFQPRFIDPGSQLDDSTVGGSMLKPLQLQQARAIERLEVFVSLLPSLFTYRISGQGKNQRLGLRSSVHD